MIQSYRVWQIYCDVPSAGQACGRNAGEYLDTLKSLVEAGENAKALTESGVWIQVGKFYGCEQCITQYGAAEVRKLLRERASEQRAQGGKR